MPQRNCMPNASVLTSSVIQLSTHSLWDSVIERWETLVG